MTSPTPADSPATFAQTVSQQFADRPTFETVAQQRLEKAIKTHYPSLIFDLATLQLAMPNEAGNGWVARPFMGLVFDYLALGTPVDFSSKGPYVCYLSAVFPKRLRDVAGKIPSMTTIETLLFELPWTLPIALEDALIRHWNAEINAQSHANRWQWLGDTLKHILHIRGLQQPGLSEPERDALDQVARWPDRASRFRQNTSPVYAYSLETTITRDGNSTVLPDPDILLQHYTIHGLAILLCSPGSAVRSFASMDAFHAHWAQRIASRYVVDTVSCQRYEIAGNAFDTQAGMLLEQQLSDLRSVKLTSTVGWPDLKKLYADLSDPARYLTDTPQPTPQAAKQVGALLPDWLKKAPLGDRTTFQHYSLALAGAKQRSDGLTFLSNIKDIRSFAVDALSSRLQQANDNSRAKAPASHFHPDNVTLTYTVAAGYPGAVGISEPREMSLTSLAINNLVARPSGQVRLSHRQRVALPEWLTNDFITGKNGLIEQVDIGTTYPRYLQRQLLDDPDQRDDRERRFAEQIPPQLLLEALKQVHNQENGMTRQGLDLLEALFAPSAEGRQVNGRPVVIRHLALQRKPHATPDTVLNIFVIESRDSTQGPHLLYRPLYETFLQQFSSRQALLDAIATAGALQDSVLTWLPDSARLVYANGGIKEPHVLQFHQGDEFDVPDKPAPATLALDEASKELLQYLGNGRLMQYLYGCNAHALVTQADHDSVSNSESRWALLLKGGNLLFNTLLFPLLRGPAMACAWLFNLMLSAQDDIPALSSDDPVTRELAAVDLLLNLALLATQIPSSRSPARVPVSEKAMEQAMRPPAPRAIAQQWPAPTAPTFKESIIALPGELSKAPGSLDFSFASARNRLTPEQRTRLQGMQVSRPAKLPEPITYGPLEGLYVIGAKWHALVERALYQVDVDVDDNVKIIDPQDPNHNGPMLKSDGRGAWIMDLNLRLRGGMPKSRIQELKDRKKKLNKDRDDFLASQSSRADDINKTHQKVRDGVPRQDGKPPKDQTGKVITPEQHLLDRQKLYQLLETQIAANLEMLASQDERRTLHAQLEQPVVVMITKTIILYADAASSLVKMDQDDLVNAHPGFDTYPTPERVRSNGSSFMDFQKKTFSNRERVIHWLNLRDQQLENLLNLDATSATDFDKLLQSFDKKYDTALTLQDAQLATLPILSVKTVDSDLFGTLTRIILSLSSQISSHSNIKHFTLPPPEHLAVLESLTEQYAKALDALDVVKTLYIEDLDETYFDKMVSLLKGLYDDVSGKLAAEVKPEPTSRKRPAKPPLDRKKKRLIMTRKSGVLIGDVKPAGTNVDVAGGSSLPIEVVEIHSEINGEVLESYSRHDDVWDVVEVERPAPVPRTRAIKTIKGDAQKLLEQLDNRLRRAESYKTRCRHPQEIEEILDNEASRYRTLSAELDRAFTVSGTSPSPADQALSQQLSQAIASLNTKGAALRIELSLKLPPTDGNLRYLFEKKLIHVARLGERKTLKGTRKDFLQEYAINDVDGFPLWYAHFHYETAETPKADYSVAHLKTKEQRREHYHSMLAKADNPYAVVNVHRGQIGRSLAQSRFLPLAP